MIMAIDIGNSKTSVGIFDGKTMVVRCDFDTLCDPSRALADPRSGVLATAGLAPKDVAGVCLASVVPAVVEPWLEALRQTLSCPVMECTAATAAKSGLFEPNYARPETLGADRVANAIAAKALYGYPAVVVDFGTATDIEVIDDEGCFVGGVIAPGLDASKTALFSHAAKLHEIEIIAPQEAIGTDTNSALLAGIVFGEADRADGLIRRVFDQLGYEALVVASGGRARLVTPYMKKVDVVDPNLTLRGLNLLFEAAGC